MAQKLIIVGTPNSREGDSLFAAFTKINENFTELYTSTGSGSSDRLVNGNSSFSISTDGTLTLTHPAEPNYHPLSTTLTIQKAAGNYHTISGAYGLSLQATPVPNGYGLNTNTNFVDIFHDGVSVNVNDNSWAFGTDGTLTLPGAFAYPNSALQRDTATVTCQGNATTVVYTVSGQYQHTIRLLIQVEGSAPGDPYDTQSCEMIIAKSFRADAIAASVYGVVHTSVAPLATFTANWNALTSRVEVLCATTAIAVNVRIFATEITTSD